MTGQGKDKLQGVLVPQLAAQVSFPGAGTYGVMFLPRTGSGGIAPQAMNHPTEAGQTLPNALVKGS